MKEKLKEFIASLMSSYKKSEETCPMINLLAYQISLIMQEKLYGSTLFRLKFIQQLTFSKVLAGFLSME